MLLKRKLLRLLSVLFAFALVAAACGGDSDDDSSSGSSDSATAAATADSSEDEAEEEEEDAPAEDTTEATAEDAAPVPTGTLRMAFSTDVQTYDPVMTGVAQTPYLQPVYDTLMIWTSDGVKPRQAEAVRIIDASTYELDIRAGITFSDGATFDAAAVVASYERAIANEASPQTPFYSNIASITATSDMTVRFELVNPTTVFLEDLTWLPGMVTSPNATDLDTVPVGAGGWVLDTDSTRAGVQQDFVARTDGYWDPDSVLVERIEMRLLQEEASVNAMLNGEIDLSGRVDTAVSDYEDAGLTLINSPGPSLCYVQMIDLDGVLLEPLGNVQVRRAMMLALDREGYNQAVLNGLGETNPGWFLPSEPWYDPGPEKYAFDLPKAKQMLADAGYPDGFSILIETIPPLATSAEAVQQMWTALGLDVSLNMGEPGTLGKTLRSGTTELTPTCNIGHPPETFYKQRVGPGNMFDPLEADRGEIADLAEVAMMATSIEGQNAGWAAVFAYAVDNGFIMPLSQRIGGVAHSPAVEGAVISPTNADYPRPYGIRIR